MPTASSFGDKMSMRSYAVATAVLAIAAVVVFVVYQCSSAPQTTRLDRADGVQQWMTALRAGENVTFETPDRELIRVTSGVDISKVSADERVKIGEALIRTINQWNADLLNKPADTTDPAAIAAEADVLYQIAVREAELSALRKSEFVVLPMGEDLMVSASEAVVINGYPVTVDGQTMRMWFALMYDQHAELVVAQQYWDSVAQFAEDDAILKFNEKPVEERSRLFEEHAEWEARHDAYKLAAQEARAAGRDPERDVEVQKLWSAIGGPVLPRGRRSATGYVIVGR